MLGTSLCRLLLEKGHDVYGLSRGKMKRVRLEKEELLQADITHQKEIVSLMRTVQPDTVIHTAAISDVDFCERNPEEAYRVNGEGSRWVAESSNLCGAALCYVSTDYVFDGENETPYREEDPCRPLNIYGKSKLQGEQVTRDTCPRHYIVRTSWLFGENRDSFVHHVLKRAEHQKEIPLVVDKTSTPTYSADLAAHLYKLLEKNAPFGTYHVVNGGGACSWLDYGQKILAVRGLNGVRLRPIRLNELHLSARRPLHSILSHEKFFQKTGEKPRAWQEALKEYLTEVTPPKKEERE